jgi:hypothetical protein
MLILKQEGVFVLFKETSREVNVIFPMYNVSVEVLPKYYLDIHIRKYVDTSKFVK